MHSDMAVEAAIKIVRQVLDAAENSNHAGEVAILKMAAGFALHKAAAELSGEIDRQTYDEKRREDFDAPPDAEYCVNLTNKMISALDAAVALAEGIQPPSPIRRDSERTPT